MRTYTAHHVRHYAYVVQNWAFYAAAACGLAFIGCALADLERPAMAVSIIGAVAIGINAGAWIVQAKFKD